MEKEKLEHLQEFFESIQLPCCIEYDVQRLLDIQYSIQNDHYISEELLRQRASEMALRCCLFLKGVSDDNKICG